jgi:hypothetical protein
METVTATELLHEAVSKKGFICFFFFFFFPDFLSFWLLSLFLPFLIDCHEGGGNIEGG